MKTTCDTEPLTVDDVLFAIEMLETTYQRWDNATVFHDYETRRETLDRAYRVIRKFRYLRDKLRVPA